MDCTFEKEKSRGTYVVVVKAIPPVSKFLSDKMADVQENPSCQVGECQVRITWNKKIARFTWTKIRTSKGTTTVLIPVLVHK
jgi:hypothetical protein